MSLSQADCDDLDRQHAEGFWPSGRVPAERFAAGHDQTLYFDANSVGPMPHAVPACLQELLLEGWAGQRRRSWNERDWLAQPASLGAGIAHLLGCEADHLRVTDTTSVNQYKLLRLALSVAAPRRVIVLEEFVFPSNRYVAEGIARAGLAQLRFVKDASHLQDALAPGDVAVVALSHVDYRSSERLDMAAINRQIRAAGALSLWDLSHSAGAVAIELSASGADLAVGCGYKYLSGGPGAPALLYANARAIGAAWPAIAGWMGHLDTFAFEPSYQPAVDAGRFLVGTPAVIANAVFACAVDIWREVDPALMERRHRSLTQTLITLVDEQCAGLGLELASPRAHARRGGHVAYRFEGAAPLVQAMLAHGVVLSARKPDALRWGVHALTTTHGQIWTAVQRLRQVLEQGIWRDPRHDRFSV